MNFLRALKIKLLNANAFYIKIVLAVIAIWFAYNCAKEGRDFEVFVDAGRKLINGLDIYAPPYVRGLPYFYSPLFALILAPFASLPIIIPQLIWVFLTYFCLYRIWVISIGYFDPSTFSKKHLHLWGFVVFFMSARFIRDDISMVQMTIFSLWAIFESLRLFNQKHNIAGAALLALAINIKLLPLAFLFYLLYRKKFTASVLTIVFFIAYLYVPALYLGWEKNYVLLHEWFAVINPGSKQWTIEADNGPSSLVALVPVYITKTVGTLPYKRNFIDLSYAQVFLILNCIRAIFILLTLLFLHTFPFKTITDKTRQYWEVSYLCIVIPLLYPHQQQYAFVFLTPAFIYIVWYGIKNWDTLKLKISSSLWVVIFIVGINFSPVIGSDIITRKVYEILLYYRVLTLAAISLIAFLWIARPSTIRNSEETSH